MSAGDTALGFIHVFEPAMSQALAELLQRCGAQVTLRWNDGGHTIADADAAAAADWFRALIWRLPEPRA